MKLFIVPSWYPSSLHPEDGTFFRDQARLLAAAGVQVVVISSSIRSFRECSLRRQFDNPGSPERRYGILEYRQESLNPGPKLPHVFFRSYRRRLHSLFQQALNEQGRPDWVWIQSSLWAGAALAPLLAELNIPFIVEEHLKEFLIPGTLTKFQRKRIQQTYHYAHRIAGPSQALVAALLSQFTLPHHRGLVIPNPVDSRTFTLPESPPPITPFTWISVGLLRKEKRYDLLLDAFSSVVRESTTPQRLIIVGDGPERRSVEAMRHDLGLENVVDITGYEGPAQVALYLKTGSAAVWASDVETFGVAPVEALACGLPVIIPNCGGPADYINDENGILATPGDQESLAGAMLRLQNRILKYNRKNIRRLILAYCGEQAFISQVQAIGEALVNESDS